MFAGGSPIPAGAFDASLVPRAQVDCDAPDAVAKLRSMLGEERFSLLILFVSPEADFEKVVTDAAVHFAGVTVIGCTTGGELGNGGYDENSIIAVGLPSKHFAASSILIPHVGELDQQNLMSEGVTTRSKLTAAHPDWDSEFAFLLVDGMSRKEDTVVAACANALGPVPLFGGSAGDGDHFGDPLIAYDGRIYRRAAVLTYVRTCCPIKVFSFDHFEPSDRRMVVTSADPEKRIVHQINAEPSAREYARMLGKDPEGMDTYTFAARPVVVRFGGTHHVRSIQRVTETGDLLFFAAIEEGLVLTLADPTDMVKHLDSSLSDLGRSVKPAAIIACDCILRRMEAQEKQLSRAISEILEKHDVVGFSTYGEQIAGMHVNQTVTGVAIYPPGSDP